MELNEFIANFAEQFDDTDASEIQASTDDDGHIRRDDYLYMDGSAIFNFTLDAVPAMMKDILAKNEMVKENIDYYVFHQANKFMLNTIRKVCVLPKDKFYVNLHIYDKLLIILIMTSNMLCKVRVKVGL